MAKKLYINTTTTPSRSFELINNEAIINYNQIIVKPIFDVKYNYFVPDVSYYGTSTLDILENNFYVVASFVFSSGGKPRIINDTKISNYNRYIISKDTLINNIILIG